MSEVEQALATLRDYVERSTHWQEGGADRHAALLALLALRVLEDGVAELRGQLEALNGHLAAVEVWKQEGEAVLNSRYFSISYHLGVWWADRPWRKKTCAAPHEGPTEVPRPGRGVENAAQTCREPVEHRRR